MDAQPESERPKFSFVVTCRNDDYGGNLLNRSSTFVRVLSLLVEKYKVPSELVFVEYNPIPGKKYLFEELSAPHTSYMQIRGVIVPSEFHECIRGENPSPFMEYIAKNIGVRRARGEYILVTNPDIIFSDELFSFFSKEDSLRQDTFYRVSRYDLLVRTFDENLTLEQIFRICRKKIEKILYNKRVIYRSYTAWLKRFIRARSRKTLRMFPLLEKSVEKNDAIIHDMAAGDFLLAHHTLWEKATGYDETPLCSYMDGYILYVLQCFGFKQKVLEYPIYHICLLYTSPSPRD